MTQTISNATSADHAETNTYLFLTTGVLAGPTFLAIALAQLVTRDGFDPTRHSLSLLSLGDAGWIQIGNFAGAGLLFGVASVGIRRALPPGLGRQWGPALLGTFAFALVAAGVLVTDPAAGFPDGRDGTGDVSWHGAAHAVAAWISALALGTATLVFGARFMSRGEWGWAAYTLASGLSVLILGLLAARQDGGLLGILAAGIGLSWASAVTAHVRTQHERVWQPPGWANLR